MVVWWTLTRSRRWTDHTKRAHRVEIPRPARTITVQYVINSAILFFEGHFFLCRSMTPPYAYSYRNPVTLRFHVRSFRLDIVFFKALNLLHLLTNHLWPLNLPLISQHSKRQIRHQQALPQTPHQRNSVEEVGIPATGIDPKVIKRGPQERRVQKRSGRHIRIPHEGENVPKQREHGEEQTRIRDRRVRLKYGKHAEENSQHGKRLCSDADGQAAHVCGQV